VDRYTGYIRYTGICLDTGIGDIDNSKIPIYRHFGILLRNTELKRCFKSNLLTITFRNESQYSQMDDFVLTVLAALV
jgi:hypothetical protein